MLMNNATLPAGDYTIPAGVTMLIPFDSANTLYTTTPTTTGTERATPSVYRTLTMASGANITVNGSISVSAKVVCGTGAGVPAGATSGPYGHIKMNDGSSITVNSGAYLYTWGYISGKGSVLAKSGSTVYESFQVEDYRGGSQTTGMKNKVFPLSQYYIQNIEVPLTLEAGATEKCYTCINVTALGEQGSPIPFISTSGSMFSILSGSVTKRYDGSTDRLFVDIDGDVTMSPITMNIGEGLLAKKINSSDYVLPVTNNLTVTVKSGNSVEMTQDMSMLPGSEIIVEEDALCDIASGVSIYAYDADEWSTYCWDKTNVIFSPIGYAHSKTYTRTTADLVDAKVVINGTIDATKGYLYTTAGGANVISTGSGKIKAQPGTATSTYQVLQNVDGDNDNYVAIPITSAKLKNADGSFVQTAGASGEYDYVNGVWDKTCYTHAHVGSVTTPAGCETEGVRTYTCECGDTYTESIAATGHTAGAGATCSSAQTCTVCGKELAAQLAHTPGAEATCTSAQTCTVCGTVIVAALGHTEVIDAAVAATCTQTGLTEGKHCSVCGEVLVAQQEVAALGHSYGEWTLAQAATKDADGYFEKACSACGDIQKDVFAYIEISDVLITVTDSGKQIDIFASAEYSELFASFDVCVAQNGNTTKITDYVLNGNSNVFTYNTLSDETLEISVRAVTKNGNAVTSDSIIKNIDRILGNAGEKFVVLETLEGSDTNEDGYTNIKDLVRLKKMIAELEEKSEAADISGDGNVAVNDMTLLAKYLVSGKRGIAAYTVAFTDGNGNVLQTVIVPEGFSAQPDVTPGKDGYVFVGWDKDFIHVTQDLVVNAVYNTVE
ncbi:MAG: dockerin type I repeat-containing protein [Clostridia bacterium]|nr:dockerin type I repeat-containing protein [Clostridia bacterium]